MYFAAFAALPGVFALPGWLLYVIAKRLMLRRRR